MEIKYTDDKGCCYCCDSYIGVIIIGILYVLSLIDEIVDLAICGGVYYCRIYDSSQNKEIMWIDIENK